MVPLDSEGRVAWVDLSARQGVPRFRAETQRFRLDVWVPALLDPEIEDLDEDETCRF